MKALWNRHMDIDKKRRMFPALWLAVFLAVGAAGCGDAPEAAGNAVAESEASSGHIAADDGERASGDGKAEETDGSRQLSEESKGQAVSLDEIPAYAGEPYVVINGNLPYFTKDDCSDEPFEYYSEFDALGRCGAAFANICQETMPTEERGPIGHVRPSGWHTVKYDIVDGNYLYNRCHLIGYQLAAENANEQNLITGTRYLNTEGMLPFENQVADYVKETDGHVLYRVTPLFEGDHLVADGVLMEAWSVEDEGAGVCFNVFVYNVQPGIGIDFATGESWQEEEDIFAADSEAVSEDAGSVGTNAPEGANEPGAGRTKEAGRGEKKAEYVLNTNTMKFHYPTCASVRQMSDENKEEYVGTRDEVIAKGYDSCGRCHP